MGGRVGERQHVSVLRSGGRLLQTLSEQAWSRENLAIVLASREHGAGLIVKLTTAAQPTTTVYIPSRLVCGSSLLSKWWRHEVTWTRAPASMPSSFPSPRPASMPFPGRRRSPASTALCSGQIGHLCAPHAHDALCRKNHDRPDPSIRVERIGTSVACFPAAVLWMSQVISILKSSTAQIPCCTKNTNSKPWPSPWLCLVEAVQAGSTRSGRTTWDLPSFQPSPQPARQPPRHLTAPTGPLRF